MADPTDPFVQQRAAIDEADRQILAALNARVAAVILLHEHKVHAGYPLSDPGREEAITSRMQELNAGPIAEDVVPEVVAAILALTRSEVTRLRAQGWGS